MSTADDDYREGLEDLFDDMESDGVDATRMLMSAVASHVKVRWKLKVATHICINSKT